MTDAEKKIKELEEELEHYKLYTSGTMNIDDIVKAFEELQKQMNILGREIYALRDKFRMV